ncbi:MAG: phosphatidylinositol-specific phospholipase C1-like protein [Xenococcaceae cyanobacterium]
MKKVVWGFAVGSMVIISNLLSGTLNARVGFEPQDLRINQIQSIGTHNSYHIEPAPKLAEILLNINWLTRFLFTALEYTHLPLSEQFDLGIRQIELDVYLDPEGGLYAKPFGYVKVEENGLPADPEFDPDGVMQKPGLKVLHMQDIDFRSTCLTFIKCLKQINTWSKNNPQHFPIVVLVEGKDKSFPRIVGQEVGSEPLEFAIPIKFDSNNIVAIEQEIRSVFSREQLLTPDDVRGTYSTLREAVLNDGWPTLAESQGKILFVMENKNDLYRKRYPSLRGASMFISSKKPDSDEAVFINLNEPSKDIGNLVKQGYLVRTRSDAETIHARVATTEQRDKALSSGAQYVSTDYPLPNEYFSEYTVLFPEGRMIRCNPINASETCRIRDTQ